MVERIEVSEFHRRLKAQGVSAREHVAVICPICRTVQSIASLMAAGCEADRIENVIGFSCEGRWTSAGPWPNDEKERAARTKRGCDWTLGGLFQIHELEVMTEDGKTHPAFMPASPDQAVALEADMTTPKRTGATGSVEHPTRNAE